MDDDDAFDVALSRHTTRTRPVASQITVSLDDDDDDMTLPTIKKAVKKKDTPLKDSSEAQPLAAGNVINDGDVEDNEDADEVVRSVTMWSELRRRGQQRQMLTGACGTILLLLLVYASLVRPASTRGNTQLVLTVPSMPPLALPPMPSAPPHQPPRPRRPPPLTPPPPPCPPPPPPTAPPPNPPPPPHPPAAPLVLPLLNAALQQGSPANVGQAAASFYRGGPRLAALINRAAGVLVRQFDGMSDWERPWQLCSVHGACTAPHRGEGTRWPATYLNAKHGGTYSSSEGGLVLDAGLVRLLCGYSQDGRSLDKFCDDGGGGGGRWPGAKGGGAESTGSSECVPGCTGHGAAWCEDTSCLDLRVRRECAWMPNQLQALLEKQDRCNPYGHNEIVVDPASVVASLPGSVLGLFYQPESNEDQKQQVHSVQPSPCCSRPSALPLPLPPAPPGPALTARPCGPLHSPRQSTSLLLRIHRSSLISPIHNSHVRAGHTGARALPSGLSAARRVHLPLARVQLGQGPRRAGAELHAGPAVRAPVRGGAHPRWPDSRELRLRCSAECAGGPDAQESSSNAACF